MATRDIPSEIGDALEGPSLVAFAIELRAEFTTAPHSHARGQMIGRSRGVVSVLTENGAFAVPAGHAIWLPPHQLHGGQSFGAGAGWTAYVAPGACAPLPDRTRIVAVPPLLREAVLRAASWDDDGMDRARQRVADLIIDEIGSLAAVDLGLPLPRDPRLHRIARSLLERPADGRSADDWAAWAGTTPRTLSRRFPQETGLSFAAWRQRVRLLRSLEMLAEGAAVTAVALDLGYGSVGGFIALFRRAFGVTPASHPIRAERVRVGPPDRVKVPSKTTGQG